MNEVSFYHLTTTVVEKALPRLLEKAHKSDTKVVVLTHSQDRAEELNNAMWTYTTKYFLPHGTKKDGRKEQQPIYVTSELENPNDATVITVVDGATVDLGNDTCQNFDRLMYMFDGNDQNSLTLARTRWKEYKEVCDNVTYWKQNHQGGWENQAA